MNKQKTIIVIPHYNNLVGLHASIVSIRESNDILLDIVIIDDGSMQKPNLNDLNKLYSLGKIFLLNNHENRGIEYVLNDGLSFAHEHGYEYIARLDCGDTCYPNRFNKQLLYLAKHPEIKLLGAWCQRIDIITGRISKFCPPTEHADIVRQLKMHNIFCHPLVIFSVSVIDLIGYYPTTYKYAEDFAYFSEIAKVAKVANLPEILLDYEINPTGISLSRRNTQLRSTLRVIKHHFDFSAMSFMGIAWYSMLLVLPYNLVTNIKKVFRK